MAVKVFNAKKEVHEFADGSILKNNAKRALESKSKSAMFWPLRAKWSWLDSSCKLKEKVVEWLFPFDFAPYDEEFCKAGLTQTAESLPKLAALIGARGNTRYTFNNDRESLDDFISKDLAMTALEKWALQSLVLEDLPGGFEYVFLDKTNRSRDCSWRMP